MSTNADKIIEVHPNKEQITSGKRNTQCSVEGCCKMFPHEGMLKMHLVKSHAQINTEKDKRLYSKIQKKATDLTYIFFCPEQECKYASGGKHFTSFHLLKQHFMKMHAERKFFCQKCTKGFSEQRFLRQHENQCGNLYTCGTCPVYYTTREALQTHCKRQEHTYPEEYRKRDKEKDEKRRGKKKTETENSLVPGMPGIPVLLLTVQKQEPVPSQGLPKLLPKPQIVTEPAMFVSSKSVEKDIVTAQLNQVSLTEISSRHEVMIQTDIYGVHNLAVSRKNHCFPIGSDGSKPTVTCNNVDTNSGDLDIHSNNSLHCKNLLALPSSSKGKQKAVKRKWSNTRPSSPRRNRSKTTTGIQTSVSLTQKKSKQIVIATQTTGDLILKRAMAEADIPIEKRTVGSQVTPDKSSIIIGQTNMGTDMFLGAPNTYNKKTQPTLKDSFSQVNRFTKPLLVDSYSQVQHPPQLVDSCSQVQYRPLLVDSCSQVQRRPLLVDSCSQVQHRPLLVDSCSQVQHRPLLVDSFSQVQQRNIIAETSENVTESQTMTDLPESISTQTFQSFLGNQQYRDSHSAERRTKFVHSDNLLKGNKEKLISKQCKKKKATVQIYNDRLEKSLTIHVDMDDPTDREQALYEVNQKKAHLKQIKSLRKSPKGGRKTTVNSVCNKAGQIIKTTSCPPQVHKSIIVPHANKLHSKEVTATSTQVISENSSTSTNIVGSTTDTEVQAMSATEFQQLLQSSGIFTELAGSSDNWQDAVQLPGEHPHSDFNLFNSNAATIDMNTQTVSDLDLFNSIGAIDMNTQTSGNDVDFLDLVMNNMETQTLNEEDLTTLGLSNICSDSMVLDAGMHSLGVGTSDFDMMSKSTSPLASTDDMSDLSLSLGYETVTHSLGIGTSDFEQETQYAGTCSSNDIMLQSANYTEENDKSCNRFLDTRPRTGSQINVQTETQTTGNEAGDQLIQMEMQTQVDSNDLDFEVTNMETQTTFEEFYDWLM